MKSIVSKIAKQILLSQDSHIRTCKEKELQKRLDQAFKNDKSHVQRLSQ